MSQDETSSASALPSSPHGDGLVIEPAVEADVAACVGLMSANAVGARVGQEAGDLAPYLDAFARMREGGRTVLHVARLPGMGPGEIVGMFELTVLDGLSFSGRPRAQVESVHVDPSMRSRGLGARMMAFAEERARERGCVLMQLASNAQRTRAHAFYERLGYEPSHLGFKRML
ncbi:GNAT family N-acetyltransferase [Stappia sp.]|uniref:GNAT family N-acetyltransferase n=1 Tax=Stappia sp. TaxID=1870903 RepID=UPI0025F43FE9|nr:GNAT family N-acetyltransferase [Stappia sp.]